MEKMMFNDDFGLTESVLARIKIMTRRIEKGTKQLPTENGKDEYFISHWIGDRFLVRKYWQGALLDQYYVKPKFKVGDVVAVAQRYSSIAWHTNPNAPVLLSREVENLQHTAGWNNKMFVLGSLMPHRIRITDVRLQRIQDIKEEEVALEGIPVNSVGQVSSCKLGDRRHPRWLKPKEAYAILIDKLSGKGTWKSNPWVIAYTFEMIER